MNSPASGSAHHHPRNRVGAQSDKQSGRHESAKDCLRGLGLHGPRSHERGEAALGPGQHRHDRQRQGGHRDADQRFLGPVGQREVAHRLHSDVGGQSGEAHRDQSLGQAVGVLLAAGAALLGQPPGQDQRGRHLDAGVQPEADEAHRPGGDARGDGDHALDTVPADRCGGEPLLAGDGLVPGCGRRQCHRVAASRAFSAANRGLPSTIPRCDLARWIGLALRVGILPRRVPLQRWVSAATAPRRPACP